MSLAPSIIASGLHARVSHILATVIRGGTGAAALVAVTSIHGLGSHIPEIAPSAAIGLVELAIAFSDRRGGAIRLMESFIIEVLNAIFFKLVLDWAFCVTVSSQVKASMGMILIVSPAWLLEIVILNIM